jgi:hypothetical protein
MTSLEDRVWDFIYKWGGPAIVIAIIAVVITYLLNVAVNILISTINSLHAVGGSIAVGILIGAGGLYGYLKWRHIL